MIPCRKAASLFALFFVFLLSACGGDKSSSTDDEVELNSSSDSGDSLAVSSSSESEISSDSLLNDDSTYTISGFVNRGQYAVGTNVVIRELDSNLVETGVVYRAPITSTNGAYSVSGVKLTQPYLYLKIEGAFGVLCYEDETAQAATMAYADIRKGSTISLNVLTLLQAYQLPKYMKRGESFEQAMESTQKDIKELFMLDSLDTDFNKTSLGESTENNFYLLAVTAISEVVYDYAELDTVANSDTLDDEGLGDFWKNAYYIVHGMGCYKLNANTKKYEYSTLVGKAKSYLDDLWEAKYNLGECSAENYNEIKSSGVKNDDWLYCDSTGWVYPNFCEELDEVYLATVSDTTEAKIIASPYCSDRYYYYLSDKGWVEADNVEAGLDRACIWSARNEIGMSGRKCYVCNGYSWKEAPDSINCDIKLHECASDGEVYKGQIYPDVSYICDSTAPRALTNRELNLGLNCIGSTARDSAIVGKSKFVCDHGAWSYGSADGSNDSLLDARDGQTYRTVAMGSQRWMAENLNYEDFDQSPILVGRTYSSDSSDEFYRDFGKFYNWNAVMNTEDSWTDFTPNGVIQGICPEGYHVPSSAEWDSLTAFADKYRVSKNVAISLKMRDTYDWTYLVDNQNAYWGRDDFGFTLKGTGLVTKGSVYTYSTKQAYLWTSDFDEGGFTLQWLSVLDSVMTKNVQSNIHVKAPIRCVED